MIKYRIWDKESECFLGEMEACVLPSGKILKFTQRDLDNFILREPVGYAIQQFTGLKDESGKEVFEGDVIDYCDQLCVVEYGGAYNMSGFMATSNDGSEYILYRSDVLSAKVLGNILENLDLVKEYEKN